jgi:hypothetical protein
MAISCRFYVERQPGGLFYIKTGVLTLDPWHQHPPVDANLVKARFNDWVLGKWDNDAPPWLEDAILALQHGTSVPIVNRSGLQSTGELIK